MEIILVAGIVLGALLLAKQSGALSSILGPAQPTQADQEVTAGESAIYTASAQGAGAQAFRVSAAHQSTATGVQIGIGAGTAVGGATATAAMTGASVSTAALTAGITAGIGVVAGVAIILWQKHEARIAGAQKEDAAWNDIMPGWIAMMQGIFQAYNSGQIDKPTAAAEVLQAKTLAYQAAQHFVGTPGTNWTGGQVNGQPGGLMSRSYWKATCNKHCTVGCCLFNNVVGPASNQALDLFTGNSNVTTIAVPQTYKSSYGYAGTPAFNLTVTR